MEEGAGSDFLFGKCLLEELVGIVLFQRGGLNKYETWNNIRNIFCFVISSQTHICKLWVNIMMSFFIFDVALYGVRPCTCAVIPDSMLVAWHWQWHWHCRVDIDREKERSGFPTSGSTTIAAGHFDRQGLMEGDHIFYKGNAIVPQFYECGFIVDILWWMPIHAFFTRVPSSTLLYYISLPSGFRIHTGMTEII